MTGSPQAAPGTASGDHSERPSQRPWLDPGLPVPERVALLMGAMTLEERSARRTRSRTSTPTTTPTRCAARGSARASSPAVRPGATSATRASSRSTSTPPSGTPSRRPPRRAAALRRDVIHGHRTVFPIPLGLAAAWTRTSSSAATTAAHEAVVDGVAWTFAPMVDLSEERVGAGSRSLGETPVLSGRMAAAMVRGPGRRTRTSRPDRSLCQALRRVRPRGGRARLRHGLGR